MQQKFAQALSVLPRKRSGRGTEFAFRRPEGSNPLRAGPSPAEAPDNNLSAMASAREGGTSRAPRLLPEERKLFENAKARI